MVIPDGDGDGTRHVTAPLDMLFLATTRPEDTLLVWPNHRLR